MILIKDLNYLLEKEDKKKIIFLSFLLLFGMALEVIGLGAVLPLLKIILEPVYLKNILSTYLNFLKLENQNSNDLIIYIIGLFVLFYLFKSIYLLSLNYYQNKLYNNLSQKISSKLFHKYLNKNYFFHIKNTSGHLIKNVLGEINHLGAYFIGFLGIITESAIAFSIVITLIFIEPLGAITVGIFLFSISAVFFQFTKSKMKKLGYERQNLEAESNKIVLEGLNGIKEIKLYDNSTIFSNKLREINNKKSRNNTLSITISQMPRYFLEFISILALCVFLIYLFYFDYEKSTLAAKLGVFVAGSFRLIPSLNKIISYSQNLKLYYPTVEILKDELYNSEHEELLTKNKFDFDSKIQIEINDFFYDKTPILKSINLNVYKNDFIGIFGVSGSGKSTLLNIISGLVKINNGYISIDNNKLANNLNMRFNCGYVSQEPIIFEGSLKENIIFGLPFKKKKYEKAIKYSQLTDFNKKEKMIINEKGLNLSGGQRQRISLARALYRDNDILILDEPTSSLDEETEEKFMDYLVKLKGLKTIVMVTHNKGLKKYFNRSFEIFNQTIREI